ncbi:MAG TPA: hypothetical protein VHC69_23135 [Polyangiaceae bacterium]|nr:hypothetical protein [Polyangiaceae bacterium]
MTRGSLFAIVLILTACGGKVEPEAVKHSRGGTGGAKGTGGTKGLEPDSTVQVDYNCDGEPTPPTRIECTGLYANLATKAIADDVHEYAPAVPLWSDNAKKSRWIYIPKGQKIDATNPNEWIFPVGTKVWKEFRLGGKRMETRLWQKKNALVWLPATYAWNDDDTAATSYGGGDVASPDGGLWHIPTPGECKQCHNGRQDNILGFEQVSLGLDGAGAGVDGAVKFTLADLVNQDLIDPPPAQTSLTVGDDGTGMAAYPLEWLHINCGVTCHNSNENALAYSAGMHLRLDPTQLDGRPVNDFESLTTTLNLTARNPNYDGNIRIVPGDPQSSLLVYLITHRIATATDDANAAQMPPIASRLVDTIDADKVIAWIAAMPKSSTADAGGGG